MKACCDCKHYDPIRNHVGEPVIPPEGYCCRKQKINPLTGDKEAKRIDALEERMSFNPIRCGRFAKFFKQKPEGER